MSGRADYGYEPCFTETFLRHRSSGRYRRAGHSNMDAREYHEFKPQALKFVLAAYHRLAAQHAIVLIEGGGSAAEINLRDGNIANMGFAEAIDCNVILVADIDKGGVFAHLVGTLACLTPSERNRVKGFVITVREM